MLKRFLSGVLLCAVLVFSVACQTNPSIQTEDLQSPSKMESYRPDGGSETVSSAIPEASSDATAGVTSAENTPIGTPANTALPQESQMADPGTTATPSVPTSSATRTAGQTSTATRTTGWGTSANTATPRPSTATQKPSTATPAPTPTPNPWKTLADEMPILSIQTESGRTIESNVTYLSASISSKNTDSKYIFTSLPASIRCRGNYTYTSVPKKSYRLKFNEKINLFGQDEGKAKNWVLLANFTDRSLLRNDVAFAMAAAMGHIPEVTSSSFVRLYINGSYVGIYQLCEQHSISSHRIDIDEQPTVLDSDYLIEMDAYASGQEGVDYFRVENKNYVVKNDEIHPGAINYLKSYINSVNNAIKNGNESTVRSLIDLDSFIDMYILQEFVRNVDVGWSSFYMVKEAHGKLRFTWPWDFDLAFGNDERLGDAPYDGLYAGNDQYNGWENSNPWFYRLMRQQWFRDLVCARWKAIGKVMTDAGIARINLVQNKWGSYMKTNFDVWPILGTPFYPTPNSIAQLQTYDAAVNQLRTWIQNRYQWLNAYFATLA